MCRKSCSAGCLMLQPCRARLEFETTNMRCSISPEKRLAILLHWLGQGFAERQLATLYRVGPATVNGILHSGVEAVMTCLVPISIRFPVGQVLHDQMLEFEEVSGLPLCAGAVDGTFMRIRKPVQWGDQYWCYKSFPAIIVLAVVNARGHYTFVDAGRAGSLGDAFMFNHSRLKANIDNGKWLVGETQVVNRKILKPYIVGDSAFALSPSLMKAFPHPAPPGRRKRLNAAVCRTRKLLSSPSVTPKGDSRYCPEPPSTTQIMLPRLLLFVVLCIMFACMLIIATSCGMSLIQICMLLAAARCLVLFQLLLTYNQLCLQLHNFFTRDCALQLHQSKQQENLFTHCDFVVL